MANTTPSIKVLIVDDNDALCGDLLHLFRKQGHYEMTAAVSGKDALEKAAHARFDIALLDLQLPDMSGIDLLVKLKGVQPELEALMVTAHSSVETAVEAMRHGAYDYLTKPFRPADLEIHIQKAFEKVLLQRRERLWLQHLSYESPRYRLVGSSPAMRKVVDLIEKVAATDVTVLVCGPSGTGKELVARALHTNSSRRTRPLVTINCAALHENLLESELFGHEKGAFSGAVATKPGLVEVAENGTLFIDEIGEMAPNLQAKLLRVLEDGHYRRVGGTQERTADVRIVAATNRDLAQEIKNGRFREDLFYRLNVVPIHLPPLRERRSDIPELIEHFLTTRQIGPMPSRIDAEAMEALMAYSWPGNVRELANVLERAQILAKNYLITMDDLPESIVSVDPVGWGAPQDPNHLSVIERHHVQRILRQENGKRVNTARILGISRRALYRLIQKYHLE